MNSTDVTEESPKEAAGVALEEPSGTLSSSQALGIGATLRTQRRRTYLVHVAMCFHEAQWQAVHVHPCLQEKD